MSIVKFLGTSDDVTTCECCGRANLKSTVAISIDDGDAVYFGSTCAARKLVRPAKEILSEARKADRELAAAEDARRDAASRAADAPWFAFLAAHGKGDDNFLRIESLGGYAAAQAAFNRSVA